MALLQKLGQGQGWLKGGFQGFQKSGKTLTSVYLAISARNLFKSDSPIVMYDTEGGSEYIAKVVREQTGQDLIGIRSRSLSDLMGVAAEVGKEGYKFLVVDSVTHVWKELQDAYLKKVNAERIAKGLKTRSRLEFQDWNPIKAEWAKWTDWYLNSKCHVIFCGRAGFTYDYEADDETGRKQLVKTGVKMKAEGEFGYEPSLLVEMEQDQNRTNGITITNNAVVLGDRFNLINGKTGVFKSLGNPVKEIEAVFNFFKPHLLALTPNAHAPIDTEVKTNMNVDEQGQDEWVRERKEREIVSELIKAELIKAGLDGTSQDAKKARTEILEECFGTPSWTEISEKTQSKNMRSGLERIKESIANKTVNQAQE
jgi:hypothetical protein